MTRLKLPIGIQTFRKMREEDHYYVDKTGMALELVASGNCFFLSRPRRFGKSLFVDTLKELFEGNRELFRGLSAEDRWDWSVRYPVIRISFGGAALWTPEKLAGVVEDELLALEALLPGYQPHVEPDRRLRALIKALHAHTGQRVVVLVDEYDKPILDSLADSDLARRMRDLLRDFYGVLKDLDAHLKFVFLTGVSKFSKVSLFSGLNQLRDITLDARWSALCGYTQTNLETIFAPELDGVDLDAVRRWYNGYNWGGEAVYNPFDVMLYLEHRVFRPYWFETGTPAFLVDLLARQGFFTPRLERLRSSSDFLSAFDVDRIEPEALLWQTGYLTLHGTEHFDDGEPLYILGYPNREVELSLNRSLLLGLGPTSDAVKEVQFDLPKAFRNGDLESCRAILHRLFASIPNDWFRNNPIAQYEGYYASVFYCHLAALGLDLRVEDATNKGRIDLVLKAPGRVFLFEFKVVETMPDGKALEQLRARGYADKYRQPDTMVTLVGIAFSKTERNVVGFEVAEA
ncbi:MAG: ATP-binding protein [Candidatus Sericytochromatia bacterium]|nr:ATP-binding protein [Candidatus Sericytochromatia bacterium]